MNSQANPFQRQRADMRRRGKSKSLVIRIPETTHAGLLHRAHCPAVLAASVALLSWCTLVGAGNVFASAGDVDPCTAVPSALIATALGAPEAPTPTLATVMNVSTCNYGNGELTLSVGYTTIANQAPPAKVAAVPGLPHGKYMTYTHSTQTAIIFYQGTAATGLYGVVRNFAKIKKSNLQAIAIALNAGMTGSPDTQTAPAGQLVNS
jgi:hypothetical protein